MKKRSRQQSEETRQQSPQEEELGALEFAAALNGEDPRHILDCLKRFIKIVRKDRLVSSGKTGDKINEHYHDGSSSSEEEQEEPGAISSRKKFKASESWKEDTRDYHVPFVGTAVAKGGKDRGAVVVGQWPTGLLKAYLERSPLAVEMTGDTLIPPAGHIQKSLLRNKQGKLSHTLYKTYLKALAELVTAAIPKEVIERELLNKYMPISEQTTINNSGNNDWNNRFLIAIIKDRLSGLFNILQEETKRGKGNCGPLAPLAVQVLSRVTLTSIENSRHVVRAMEQSLSEGIWKAILRLPPVHKQQKDDSNSGGKQSFNLQRELGRTQVLILARALVQTRDSTVFHYSSSPGSKDRKMSPGLLVLALRDACKDIFESSDTIDPTRKAYFVALMRFLQALREALWDPGRLLSMRRWAELFSTDVLQNLCDISLQAPPLTKPFDFRNVLNASDTYETEDTTPLQQTGAEARRLLWPLLVDPSRSPLLQVLQHGKSIPESKSNHTEQAVIRSVCRLLDFHSSSGKLGLQACICQGMRMMPTLLPALFQKLTVPDSTKRCFPFVARLRFIAQMLGRAPLPSKSLVKDILSCVMENNVDAILQAVTPMALKKNVYSKAIQSKNALIVSETLKALICVLQRLGRVKQEVEECKTKNMTPFWDKLLAKFTGFLPDIQVVLSVLSRFDIMGDDSAAIIVYGHLAQLLLSYRAVLPNVLREVKFDWIKLLPSSSERFCLLPLFLQVRLLRTLEAVMRLPEVTSVTPASCRSLLEVMTRCRSPVVHEVSRRICCFILQHSVPGRSTDSEIVHCLTFEICSWVDCMTASDIPEFCSVLQQASELSFQSDISFLRAWNKAGLPKPIPKLSVSTILVAAMSALQTGSYSRSFAFLLNQVAAKCLLYVHNPLPLASLIVYFYDVHTDDEGATGTSASKANCQDWAALFEYAYSLVKFAQFTGLEREGRLGSLLAACFSKDCFYHKIVHLLSGHLDETGMKTLLKNTAPEDLSAMFRQVLHIVTSNDNEKLQENCLPFIRLILPVVLESCNGEAGLLLRSLYSRLFWCNSNDLKYIDLCVLCQNRDAVPDAIICRTQEAVQATVGDAAGGSEGFLGSEQKRKDVLSLAALRKFLPLQILDKISSGLLRLCQTQPVDAPSFASLTTLAVGCVQELLDRAGKGRPHTLSEANVVFDAWVSLTGRLEAIDATEMVVPELILCLERLICSYFSSRSVASAQIYASSLRHAAGDLLEHIFATKALCKSNRPNGACMLVHMLESDSCRFKRLFIKYLSGMNEHDGLQELWITGSIDEAVHYVFRRDDRPKGQQDDLLCILEYVVDRAISLLSETRAPSDLEGKYLVLEMLSYVNKGLLAKVQRKVALATKIADVLKSPMMKNIIRKLSVSSQLALFRVALVLREVVEGSDNEQAHIKGVLSTTLFVRLCEVLPRSLKKYTKALEENRPVNEVLEPKMIIDWLCPIVGEFPSFDMECLAALDPQCTSTSLRACLKYGLVAFEGIEHFAAIAPDCLKLARELILGIAPGSSSGGVESEEFPPPSEVYEMIVSHSNFYESLAAPSDGPSGTRKLELLRLLLSCVSLSDTTIIFEEAVWEALFSSYKAGVEPADLCLRRLLHVAARKQEKSNTLPCMDQFRWKGVSLDDSKDQYLWAWLLNSLELGRVRQTLRSFPTNDGLVPSPVPEVELWAALEPSSVNNSGTMDIDEPDGESTALRFDDNVVSASSTTKKTSSDERYSPGYVLPLLLAALENCVEETCSGVGKTVQDAKTERNHRAINESDPRDERLARVAQRLCEKGALALTLGTLCSKCSSLRQVAVSVLGLLIRAVNTKEARELSSWRERPQLAMLLNSVHRSLATRRSILLSESKEDGHETSASSAWTVPLFPGFSAVFLARACLILTRPGDDMYPSLNRFFLSIESNHGAFKDMNRLPAFIAMLCSSADEPVGQASRERLWALELFRDGFLDPFCFKMASTCHAPELLLTAFYNYRMRSEASGGRQQEAECLLLLEALSNMLKRGGRRAAHYLISRMGLLSWLRAVLLSDPLLVLVPTNSCRVSLLELVAVAVLQAVKHDANGVTQHEDTYVLLEEATALAQPTLQFCLNSIEEAQNSDNKRAAGSQDNSEDMSALVISSLEALSSFKSVFEVMRQHTKDDWYYVRNNGVHVSSALEFLSKISSFPSLEKIQILAVFTSLPVHCSRGGTKKDDDPIVFSELVLEALATQDGCSSALSEGFVKQALERSLLLLQLSWHGKIHKKAAVVRKLLDCQSKCFQWEGTREMWFQCLKTLYSSEETSGMEDTRYSDDSCVDLNALGREILEHYRTTDTGVRHGGMFD